MFEEGLKKEHFEKKCLVCAEAGDPNRFQLRAAMNTRIKKFNADFGTLSGFYVLQLLLFKMQRGVVVGV